MWASWRWWTLRRTCKRQGTTVYLTEGPPPPASYTHFLGKDWRGSTFGKSTCGEKLAMSCCDRAHQPSPWSLRWPFRARSWRKGSWAFKPHDDVIDENVPRDRWSLDEAVSEEQCQERARVRATSRQHSQRGGSGCSALRMVGGEGAGGSHNTRPTQHHRPEIWCSPVAHVHSSSFRPRPSFKACFLGEGTCLPWCPLPLSVPVCPHQNPESLMPR